MASTTNADGTTGGDTGSGAELAGRLSEMGNRTSLMVIGAALRAASLAGSEAAGSASLGSASLAPFGQEAGFAGAAAEMQALARRMLQATQDFQAVICEPAE